MGSAGDWDIGGQERNKFVATGNSKTLDSVFIPVTPSTTYYLRYRGNVDTVVVQGYQINQSTPTVVNGAFSPSGSDFEATIVGDADTDFIQWQVTSDAATGLNEEFYDIEVRETDAAGDLIWNEDLLNHYLWGSGVDMLSNELSFDTGTTDAVSFGESDNTSYNIEVEVTEASPNPVTIAPGVQDLNNRYEVRLIGGGTDEIQVWKISSGIPTQLYSASQANGDTTPAQTITSLLSGVSSSAPLSYQVEWNDPNATDAGAFKVTVGGFVVENGDWVDDGGGSVGGASGTEDYVVDLTFSDGSVALLGDSAVLDDLIVRTWGFCVQNANLTLAALVTITILSGGVMKLKNVVVNATRSAFVLLSGGTFVEDNVTYSDESFDPNINGIMNFKCANLRTPGDIILGHGGQLNMEQVTIRHETAGQKFRIISKNSLVVPSINAFNGVRFYDLITTIREMNPLGITYELDDTFPSGPFVPGDDATDPLIHRGELVQRAKAPSHPKHFSSTPIQGRQANRNVAQGFGDRTLELGFTSHDNMCLFGQLSIWRDNETQLEVVSTRGILQEIQITFLEDDVVEADEQNILIADFDVEFREFVDGGS
jgi:hypothetical protein